MWHEWSPMKKLIWLRRVTSGMSYILKTVTGAIVHIMDAVAGPIDALSVAVEPVQNLNGYDNPWPAGGGKNICPPIADGWVDGYVTTDGSVNPDTTNGEKTSPFIKVEEGLAYSFSYNLSGTPSSDYWSVIGWYDENNTFLRRNAENTGSLYTVRTATAPSGAAYARVSFRTYNMANWVQFEQSSSFTSYAPYSNICPITGWNSVTVNRTGVNVWDEEVEPGKISYDYGQNLNATTRLRSKNYISVKAGEQYYIKSPAYIEKFAYDANKNFLGYVSGAAVNKVWTVPDDVAYMRICIYTIYGTTYNHDISINYPSTDTEYHAYNGSTIPVTFPTPPRTIYGGALDVVNGKMTVDRYYLHVDAVKSTWGASNGFVRCYRYMTGYDTAFNTPLGSGGIGICNMLTYYSNMYNRNAEGVGLTSGANGYFSIALTTERLNLSGSETSAELLAAMNAWLLDNPLYILYPLDTPIELTLTPEQISTLQGTNNVWSDAGNVTMTYRASAS